MNVHDPENIKRFNNNISKTAENLKEKDSSNEYENLFKKNLKDKNSNMLKNYVIFFSNKNILS